jgi:hypothetical protein
MKSIASKLATSAIAALALSAGAAHATVALSGQYDLSATATHVSGNEYTFDYSVTNVNQTAGGQTGFDGFTIFVPDSAVFVGSTQPLPYVGTEHNPGFWSEGSSAGLDLLGDGSQNLAAPAGYHAYTWWGQYTESVYQVGSTAHFSITLDNVSAGTNTVGMSSYFNYYQPQQPFASNQWGNYTTFTATAASPLAAVPEPETYAMLFAGLGLMAFAARRRKA